MKTRQITLRPGADADRESVTRIFDMANPSWATSAAHWRQLAAARTEPANGIVIVAEDHGRMVGAARANEALEGLLPQPGTFSARVAVDPGAAGDGVGSVLWRAASDWISEQSPTQINSWCDRDDERTIAIAAHWAFERRNESLETPEDLDPDQPWAWNYELRLDSRSHANTEDVPALPPNVTVSPLGEVMDDADLAASLHEGYEECRADVPAWEPYKPRRRSDFLKNQHDRLQHGGLGLVAHRNRDVVAATFAERAAFVPMIHNDFTMVRRNARGQRLALGLKRQLIRDAASCGLERITTEVRTDNGPMLAINARLGFRRIAMRQLTRTPAIAIG